MSAPSSTYKAVVQLVLLYGSKTWNLTTTALVRLEGFCIRATFLMAKKHKPRRGSNHVWVYPSTGDLLKECGMHSIAHYIDVRWETIFDTW
jgi:hypothetical protein